MRTYNCKDTKNYINSRTQLPPHLRLCNKLLLLVTEVLKFVNNRYQRITQAQDLRQLVLKYKSKNGFSVLVSYLWLGSFSTTFPLLLWIWIYYCYYDHISITSKYLYEFTPSKIHKIDINHQIPLTPSSRLCNRIRWLVTGVLNIINNWNQKITRGNYLLQKYCNENAIKGLPCLSLPFFGVGTYLVLTYFLQKYDAKKLLTLNNCDRNMSDEIWSK